MAGYMYFNDKGRPLPPSEDLRELLKYLEAQLLDDYSPYYQFSCPFDMIFFLREDIDRNDLTWTRKFVGHTFSPVPHMIAPFHRSPLELLCNDLCEFINYIEINRSIFY